MIAEGDFGRPRDIELEKIFMQKIRGDKLQAINAECDLEICLAFNSDYKPSKKQRARKKQTYENAQMIELVLVLPIGSLASDRRQYLHAKFKELKQAWQFQQIDEDEPLPDYFFQDGCDLSYILQELQKSGSSQFTAQDLIFLELLCLQGRKLLNQKIMTKYKENMNYMLLAMDYGLKKIQQRLNTQKNKSKQAYKDIQDEENGRSQNQISLQMNNKGTNQKKKKKTKKIKKRRRNSRRNNDTESQQQAQCEDQQSQLQYPQQKQLILKTCNFISWAYWYILKKE